MYPQRYRYRRYRSRRNIFVQTEEAIFPLLDIVGCPAMVLGLDNTKTVALIGYREHTPNAPFVPPHTPVLAVRGGTVISVTELPEEGVCVIVDHHNGFTTAYAGLVATDFAHGCRARIERGQVLGRIGAPVYAPLQPLRFTIYRALTTHVPGFPRAIDPMIVLPSWRHLEVEKRSLERVGDELAAAGGE